MKEKIQKALDVIICVLLLVVTISKGGFYKEDILFPVTVICVIGFIYVIINIILNIKENGVIKKNKLVTILDFAMIALLISYLLPIVFRKYVSLENSIFEFIRYASTSIVYFIVRTSKKKKIYLNLILIISCIKAVFGLDEVTYRIIEKIGLPINYLPSNGSVVSSIVQYANVAAILMIIGINISLYKFNESGKAYYIFLGVLLQSVMFLTTSRMALVITLTLTIVWCTFYYKYQKLGHAILSVIIYALSLVMAGIISSCVDRGTLYIVYALYVVVAAVIGIFSTKKNYIYSFFEKIKSIAIKDKRVFVYIGIVLIAIFLLVIMMPGELKVSNATKVVRLNDLNIGDNNFSFDIAKQNDNTKYNIVITKIYDTYKPEEIVNIDEKDLSEGHFSQTINITENIKYVQIEFNVSNGYVIVDNAKVNEKNIALSYAFIPDRLAYRIKTDFVLDLNNTLRINYYKDGLKLWKTSPFVGLGGEGFKLCYQSVQDKSYISSEAHSGFIQSLVETGIIGEISYVLIQIMALWLCFALFKTDNTNIAYLLSILSLYIMGTFDLIFSFAVVTYILAVLIGICSNVAINSGTEKTYEYKSDNKSLAAMLKLGGFCIIGIVLCIMSKYMIDVYKASMIQLPDVDETSENYDDELYEKLTLLEKKVELDRYNINYMVELDSTYYAYIDTLKSVALNAIEESEKSNASTILAEYILRQKANADNIVECEYYNKYAIEKVAICYFENYIRYSEIMSNNFENDEVAYAFYLNYALKLTNRIIELGPKNKVAYNMYESILKTYIDALTRQNKYIRSTTIDSVVLDMKKALDVI